MKIPSYIELGLDPKKIPYLTENDKNLMVSVHLYLTYHTELDRARLRNSLYRFFEAIIYNIEPFIDEIMAGFSKVKNKKNINTLNIIYTTITAAQQKTGVEFIVNDPAGKLKLAK